VSSGAEATVDSTSEAKRSDPLVAQEPGPPAAGAAPLAGYYNDTTAFTTPPRAAPVPHFQPPLYPSSFAVLPICDGEWQPDGDHSLHMSVLGVGTLAHEPSIVGGAVAPPTSQWLAPFPHECEWNVDFLAQYQEPLDPYVLPVYSAPALPHLAAKAPWLLATGVVRQLLVRAPRSHCTRSLFLILRHHPLCYSTTQA
jgi:hypothetical protein